MRNIKLKLAYDGTNYHGWQVQQNAVTIQQKLQDALEKVFKARPDVIGCSRTDAGVHANEFVVNFKTETAIPCRNLKIAINAYLPQDIGVFDCTEVDLSFHARYNAKAKEYIYKIYNSDTKDPFLNRYSLFYPYKLDIDLMNEAAAYFIGTHDFYTLCAANSKVRNTTRTLSLLNVERSDNIIILKVRGNGFLYNMVRILTGTLLYVAQGKIAPRDIPAIIDGRDRTKAGPTVPPNGLFLNKVFY
jgi:tRNA pseudouridine38-40 synthase